MKELIIIGYSGHSFVVCGILESWGYKVIGYCDNEEKKFNPFSLRYFQKETSETGLAALAQYDFFIAIGNNSTRKKIYVDLEARNLLPVNALHPSAVIDYTADISSHGVLIASNVSINALAKIGAGAICNTHAVIEHQCVVGSFAHIAPGAVLCGNVTVGEGSFVGAGSVIRENLTIGNNVIIGAGSVVVKDIPDNVKVMGNPARIIK
jgi:sugar O-acyltransferase (sialic acid O-acetyltransferase NeuD family)